MAPYRIICMLITHMKHCYTQLIGQNLPVVLMNQVGQRGSWQKLEWRGDVTRTVLHQGMNHAVPAPPHVWSFSDWREQKLPEGWPTLGHSEFWARACNELPLRLKRTKTWETSWLGRGPVCGTIKALLYEGTVNVLLYLHPVRGPLSINF